jgi:hypothetical protein
MGFRRAVIVAGCLATACGSSTGAGQPDAALCADVGAGCQSNPDCCEGVCDTNLTCKDLHPDAGSTAHPDAGSNHADAGPGQACMFDLQSASLGNSETGYCSISTARGPAGTLGGFQYNAETGQAAADSWAFFWTGVDSFGDPATFEMQFVGQVSWQCSLTVKSFNNEPGGTFDLLLSDCLATGEIKGTF